MSFYFTIVAEFYLNVLQITRIYTDSFKKLKFKKEF